MPLGHLGGYKWRTTVLNAAVLNVTENKMPINQNNHSWVIAK